MMTITTQMDAQAQAESHYIIIPLGEVDEFWGSWLALGGRKSMSAQISAHIHPCGSSSLTKCKITEGKISRSTFHPPSGGKEHTKTGTMSTMPGRLSTTSGGTMSTMPGRLSTTSGDTPCVAALQCYSSKTSNAKLKKKFILYIFICI